MRYLFIIIISLSVTPTYSQHPSSSKVVYGELFGAGGWVTANYDMRFHKGNDKAGFRAGISAIPTDEDIVLFFPVGLNYLIGKNNKHFVELGAGRTFLTGFVGIGTSDQETVHLGYNFLELGYRYQPIQKHIMFRATWSPVFTKEFFEAKWFGVSVGYKF